MNKADVEAAIKAWHDSDSEQDIYVVLGWTWEQYVAWVQTGALPDVTDQ